MNLSQMTRKAKIEPLTIISLGMGTQSTAMYFMSSKGEIRRADYAIFADPGGEHPETDEYLIFLKNWQSANNGIPIIHLKEKNLLNDLLNENSTGRPFVFIPVYTKPKGQLRRQCTSEYKIQPIIKKIRELYGLKKRQWLPKTNVWIGYTIDEYLRVKDSPNKRIVRQYPLIDKGMKKIDCIRYFKEKGLPVPVKSACTFCPYQTDSRWADLQLNYPHAWDMAVKVDESARNSTKKGIKEPVYLHKSLKPLREIKFDKTIDMFEEIEDDDHCNSGHCFT